MGGGANNAVAAGRFFQSLLKQSVVLMQDAFFFLDLFLQRHKLPDKS